jgi:ribosome-binding factor A
MSYRTGRVANAVRDIVSDAIANRVSDPRVSPMTSITRVEMTQDLKFADVYISVMGPDTQAATTMKGLQSARGMIQSRVAKQLNLRQCPTIRLHLDNGIKIGIETIKTLDAEFGTSPAEDGDADGDTDTHNDENDPRTS